MYNQFVDLNLKYWKRDNKFSRVFFDEADSIKIPNCKYINASFIWFVTSSYKTLINYNRRDDLYDINENENYYHKRLPHNGFIKYMMGNMNILSYNIIKNIVIKNKDDFVVKSFNLPQYINKIIKCRQNFHIDVLGNSISSTVMNYLNAGDINGAINYSNCNKIKETNLVYLVTQNLEKTLQNLNIELEMKSKMSNSTLKLKDEIINKITKKIVDCKNKINGIKDKLENSKQCSICYDDLKNTTVSNCCKTKYCFECITKWHTINKKCPFCRKIIIMSELIIISNKTIKFKVKHKDLNKIENLEEIIKKGLKKDNFKLLVFSEFYNTFGLIYNLLEKYNLSYSNIKGSTNCITNIINNYKKNDSNKIDVLLLNAKYCANGLNLENTTDIVFYHKMGKDKTEQIIGRGQRPGRISQLTVWKLFYGNEL